MDKMGLIVTDKDRENGIETYAQKIAGEIKGKDVPNIREDSIENEEFKEAVAKMWDGTKVSAAGRELGRTFTDKVQEKIDQLGYNWMNTFNPRLLKYLDSSAAGSLGLDAPDKPDKIVKVEVSSGENIKTGAKQKKLHDDYHSHRHSRKKKTKKTNRDDYDDDDEMDTYEPTDDYEYDIELEEGEDYTVRD